MESMLEASTSSVSDTNPTAMGRVRAVIKQRRKRHERDRYISWLYEQAQNGASLEVIRKIGLIVAYFHLAFADINRRALYYPNPTDDYMRAINAHTAEDGTHFRLLLSDFKVLGYDDVYKASDILGILWSSDNLASRDLTYTFFELAVRNQHPGIRYAIMEVSEQQGNILFTAYFNLVKQIAANGHANSEDFVFFGEKHLLLEQGHLVNQEIDEQALFDTISLTPDEVDQAIRAVHAMWDAFERWHESILATLSDFDRILPR